MKKYIYILLLVLILIHFKSFSAELNQPRIIFEKIIKSNVELEKVNFIVSSQGCRSCFAIMLNNLSTELKKKSITSKNFIFSDSDFNVKRLEQNFSDTLYQIKDTSFINDSYLLLKTDNFYYLKSIDISNSIDTNLSIIENLLENSIKVESHTIDNAEMFYSSRVLSSVDTGKIVFEDFLNRKVYSFTNNKIKEFQIPFDSLVNIFRLKNKEKLPHIWPNGKVDTICYYDAVNSLKNKPYDIISSYFDQDGKLIVFFKILKEVKYNYNHEKNIQRVKLLYTKYQYNTLDKKLIEHDKIEYIGSYIETGKYSFINKLDNENRKLEITNLITGKIEKELVYSNKRYFQMIELKNSILIYDELNYSRFIYVGKDSLEVQEFKLNHDLKNVVLTPNLNNEKSFVLISDFTNFYNYNLVEFEDGGLSMESFFVHKDKLMDLIPLGYLPSEFKENQIIMNILTEQQKILNIQISKAN